jgi:hypothetical protein
VSAPVATRAPRHQAADSTRGLTAGNPAALPQAAGLPSVTSSARTARPLKPASGIVDDPEGRASAIAAELGHPGWLDESMAERARR